MISRKLSDESLKQKKEEKAMRVASCEKNPYVLRGPQAGSREAKDERGAKFKDSI